LQRRSILIVTGANDGEQKLSRMARQLSVGAPLSAFLQLIPQFSQVVD
jgi:hypothetical protein